MAEQASDQFYRVVPNAAHFVMLVTAPEGALKEHNGKKFLRFSMDVLDTLDGKIKKMPCGLMLATEIVFLLQRGKNKLTREECRAQLQTLAPVDPKRIKLGKIVSIVMIGTAPHIKFIVRVIR